MNSPVSVRLNQRKSSAPSPSVAAATPKDVAVPGEPTATAVAAPYKKPTVAFIINSMTGGGAERSLANLLNFAKDRLDPFDVHLILLDKEPEHQTINGSVSRTTLDSRHSLWRSVLLTYKTLRRLQPDVTVSYLTRSNCANIIASRLLGFPCIISERVHTSSHFGSGFSAFINKLMVRLLYPRADATFAVSNDVATDLRQNFGVSAERLQTINNPIGLEAIERAARESPPFDLPPRFIVAAGRFVPNKNFPLLIRAFQKSGLDIPLLILGDGPTRPELTALIEQFGLADRVIMPGYVANPYPIISRAHFFVSSSNAEGFPNALVEATALGCPVVATDCRAGPAEILNYAESLACKDVVIAKHGVLVPVNSIDHLAEAMKRMMDEPFRLEIAERGSRRARDFSPEIIVGRFMDLLTRFVGQDAGRRPPMPASKELR